jgi:AcrR family transcriptional regulator
VQRTPSDYDTIRIEMDSKIPAAGRPRDDEARSAILHASLSLVIEFGYRSLTIEKIAARAGTGKTTIYRWWPSKAAVVMEAFLTYISPEIEFPNVSRMTACESIRRQMQCVARVFVGPHGAILRALMAEAQLDRELAQAFVTGWALPRRQLAMTVLETGIASGELRGDVDVDVAIDALYGGLYYRFLIPYAPLSPKYAGQLADAVLEGLRNRSL